MKPVDLETVRIGALYMWFAVAAWVPLSLWLWYRSVSERLDDGSVEQAALRRLVLGLSVAVILCSFALAIVSLATGRPTICTRLFVVSTAGDLANNVVVLGTWTALVWWLWARGGGEQLARVTTALARASGSGRTYAPPHFKWAITGVLVAIAVLHLVVGEPAPTDPFCGP